MLQEESVIVLNDATTEVEDLGAEDIDQNEKIVTEGSNSKVTITQTDGKDITLIGKDTLTLDQDSNNNETVADISALQQAILKGTDLNALEETAAGGPQAGGNGGDGVSLSSTSFAEGGHISNINANVGSIDALSLAAGGDNSFGVSGGSAVGAGAEATGPALPAGSIKIPLSAYTGEDISSGLLTSFHSSIPHGYHLYRHTDGRDYLTPDDPTTPSAFDYKEGWYVSKDGNLAIGQDNAKDLAVTSTNKSSDYPDDNSVAKIVDPDSNLKVFGSDTPNNITVDNTKITSVHSGVGNDNVDAKNGAELVEIFGGSGNDDITVNNSTVSGRAAKDYKGNDIKEAIIGGEGNDTISVQNKSNVKGNISGDQGSNTITVESGSKVAGWVYGANAKTANMYNETGKNTITVTGENTDVSRVGDVSSGDSTITISNKAKVKSVHGDRGVDTITVDNATVAEKIEGGHGDDKIYVRNGARVEGYVTGDLDNDTININGNAKVQGGFIGAGAGADDKVNISGNAEVSSAFLKLGASSYNSGKTTDKTTLNVTGDAVIDGVTILSGDSLGKQVMNFHQNGEAKVRQIAGSNNKDVIDIAGNFTVTGTIDGNGGDDEINIHNGATAKFTANMGEGVDTLTVSNATLKDSIVDMGSGIDKININSGAKLEKSSINAGAGEDIIKIEGKSATDEDRIVFDSSSLNTGADNDVVEVTNTKFMNSNNRGLSELITGDGDDTITIKEGTIFQDFSYIAAGNGVDTITLESGAKFNQANVYADAGDDIINVNGAEFKDGGIHGGVGGDQIFVNSGKFDNASIEGDAGDDTIHIKAGARFENSSIYGDSVMSETGNDTIIVDKGATLINTTIDGGAGYDTLKVADNSIDFSHVRNIERLDMTNGENTNLTLTASNVQDILRDSNESTLRIDGDKGDRLKLTDGGWDNGHPSSNEGYTLYSNGTTIIEVKNDVHVDL